MSDQPTEVQAPMEGQTSPENEPAPPTESDTDWKAEAEKWKGLARKHETNWKAASSERDKLAQAQMTESEKAIEEARAEGRQAALSEVGRDLATAHLAAQAAKAGVTIPQGLAAVMDVSRLLNEDGMPDEAAISSLVDSFASSTPTAPAYSQGLGIGPQGSTPGQITRDDLKRMSPQEINKARQEGRLNHLISGG